MRRDIAKLIAVLGVFSFVSSAYPQDFFHAWENRVRATSEQQPAWPVPVATPTAVIVQLARFDLVRQYTSTHTTTLNYDNGKGVNLIPFARTEVDFNFPPYVQHNTPKVKDGAGDFSVVAKYRPFDPGSVATIRLLSRWHSQYRREATRMARLFRRLRRP
jgi:hypothetical protein